ncbi:MAG: inverse autotransporter beta domain-containing protein [Gammaproteobacteria bacterium]|nr:inverse autotransporter beta domain-containing protein [Gammaproteobacteria bacterium]
MLGKRTKRTLIFAASIAVTCQALAHATHTSTQQAIDVSKQMADTFFNKAFNSTNKPDWATRTDVTYDIQTKHVPITGVETIQPLFETNLHTLFWQGRASYLSGTGTGNLGLGYRYLRDDKQLMWGINTFYDQTFHYGHQRVGLGGELFTPFVTARANYYDAVSGKKRVGTVGNITDYERALSGVDAGIETPMPYASWMRFTALGYHWNGKTKSDINGGSLGFRAFPARQLEIDGGVAYDNDKHTQAFLKLNYYLGSAAFIENSATTPHDHSTFAAQNLENMRLQKVIRNNNVVVEKSSAITPVAPGINIGRGN